MSKEKEQTVSVGALTTLTEAHRRLGVTVETVRRWADIGDIRAVRIGGRRLLFSEDVERLADERGQTVNR